MLELDAAHLFELHPRIAGYREQPAVFMYPDGARVRRYTPDFEVQLVSGKNIKVEIKPEASMLDPEVRHKLAMVEAHMLRLGETFVVLTDGELRREPRQANVRSIYRKASRIPPTHVAAVMAVARAAVVLPAPLSEASSLFAADGGDVFSLLQLGLLRCELNAPLGNGTQIHLTPEDDDGWFRLSQEHDF